MDISVSHNVLKFGSSSIYLPTVFYLAFHVHTVTWNIIGGFLLSYLEKTWMQERNMKICGYTPWRKAHLHKNIGKKTSRSPPGFVPYSVSPNILHTHHPCSTWTEDPESPPAQWIHSLSLQNTEIIAGSRGSVSKITFHVHYL